MRYPSDFVDAVCGIKPDKGLLTWDKDQVACSHCARPIVRGDQYSPSSLGSFFSDSRDLSDTGKAICWRCVVLRKKPMLYGLSNALITPEGIFSIAKDVHKAFLFTTPPPAPFLVVHSSSTMQHLTWRTPVTLDNRLIAVRFGPKLFTIRPERIRQALAIADRMNEGEKKWRAPLYLDRKCASEDHGKLIKHAMESLDDASKHLLTTLTAGEYWALSYLMHAKRPAPEQPDNITDKVLSKLD